MNKSDVKTKKMLETVNFGKKMIFGQQENSHDVLEEHLRAMRSNVENKKALNNARLRADNEYINKVSDEIAQQEDNKLKGQNALKEQFLEFNDRKKLLNVT